MEAPPWVCIAVLEAPPFVCNYWSQKARPSKRRMQLMVPFNIKNTITWRLRLVYAPPLWRLRLLYATPGRKRAVLKTCVWTKTPCMQWRLVGGRRRPVPTNHNIRPWLMYVSRRQSPAAADFCRLTTTMSRRWSGSVAA